MRDRPPCFYRMAFGMGLIAYAGPETRVRDRASYVLQQGKIRFVLTTPLRPGSGILDHIHRHGDGVRDVALWVDDAKQSWREQVVWQGNFKALFEAIEREQAERGNL